MSTIFQNFKHSTYHSDIVNSHHETRFNYDEIPYIEGDVALSGYFQSLKYFKDFQNEFIGLLKLPTVDRSFINDKSVAVHIRRGDYMRHNKHLVCNSQYFRDNIEKFEGYDINVFTDSPEIVIKEMLGISCNIIQTGDELKDLTLMSLHDNLICSNSSFSWWASFLGRKKKRVIFPDRWFNDFEQHDDIYREEFEIYKMK
jgi:hypothetical protein